MDEKRKSLPVPWNHVPSDVGYPVGWVPASPTEQAERLAEIFGTAPNGRPFRLDISHVADLAASAQSYVDSVRKEHEALMERIASIRETLASTPGQANEALRKDEKTLVEEASAKEWSTCMDGIYVFPKRHVIATAFLDEARERGEGDWPVHHQVLAHLLRRLTPYQEPSRYEYPEMDRRLQISPLWTDRMRRLVGPTHLRPNEKTERLLGLLECETPGDVIVLPGQLGYFHRGVSSHHAKTTRFAEDEFGMTGFMAGCAISANPGRFFLSASGKRSQRAGSYSSSVRYSASSFSPDVLWIDCPGDEVLFDESTLTSEEYDRSVPRTPSKRNGKFELAPCWHWKDCFHRFSAFVDECACAQIGSATVIMVLPQRIASTYRPPCFSGRAPILPEAPQEPHTDPLPPTFLPLDMEDLRREPLIQDAQYADEIPPPPESDELRETSPECADAIMKRSRAPKPIT